jgi:methylamine dehydrogenase accessory protein MauD
MEALIVSNVLLWILVIALSLTVFALARQVGVLHERVAPAGALTPTSGPKVGEQSPRFELADLRQRPITIGGVNDAATLVMFISPTCPVCRGLVPTARALARQEGLALVFASDGEDVRQHETYADDLDLGDYPYVLSEALGMRFGVSKLPFALLIDGSGVLVGKGLVNTREHLESLVEAMRTGVSTLQEFVLQSEDANGQVTEQLG